MIRSMAEVLALIEPVGASVKSSPPPVCTGSDFTPTAVVVAASSTTRYTPELNRAPMVP